MLDLQAPVYALDSTFVDLSLALCPWANWTGTDATVKLHTMLDLRGSLPVFAQVSEGSFSDQQWLDHIPIEPGSYFVMDRGYAACGITTIMRSSGLCRIEDTFSSEVAPPHAA